MKYYNVFFNGVVKDSVSSYVTKIEGEKTFRINLTGVSIRLEVEDNESLGDKIKTIEGFGEGIRKIVFIRDKSTTYEIEEVV